MELLVPAVTLQLWDIQTELRKAKGILPQQQLLWGRWRWRVCIWEIKLVSKSNESGIQKSPVTTQMAMLGMEQWWWPTTQILSWNTLSDHTSKPWENGQGIGMFLMRKGRNSTEKGLEWALSGKGCPGGGDLWGGKIYHEDGGYFGG